MAVFRIAKVGDFTTMSNHHLKNRNLSLKAVGLLSKMLSLPDGWDYTLKGLAKLNTDGIDSVRSALKELENAGYITRRQLRDEKGRMSRSEYLVFEIPELAKSVLSSPSLEKPISVKAMSDNPTQVNTNQVINQEENTLLINDPSINHSYTWHGYDGMDAMAERKSYEELIRENLEVDILSQREGYNIERVNEIIEIMLDAICSQSPTIRVNNSDMPQEVVKSRLLKLNSSHLEYVFDAMEDNPSEIRNIRAYLLTALYNAPVTMDNHYTALVNHDLNGGRRRRGKGKSYSYDDHDGESCL